MRDFLDVFSEELLGVLPKHDKVEFGIEANLGTTPMYLAPYKMALKELKELKI